MTKNYQTKAAPAATETELAVPDAVSVAMADIAATAREGLLAVAVTTGLAVMDALMDESVAAFCGPKGRHNPERTAVRHGGSPGRYPGGGWLGGP